MPAIQILIDTDPKDNTTTVDAWAIDADGVITFKETAQ